MAYSDNQKNASLKYKKEKQQAISLSYKQEDYDNKIKPIIEQTGLPVATFIKKAIEEKIEREKKGIKTMEERKRFICRLEILGESKMSYGLKNTSYPSGEFEIKQYMSNNKKYERFGQCLEDVLYNINLFCESINYVSFGRSNFYIPFITVVCGCGVDDKGIYSYHYGNIFEVELDEQLLYDDFYIKDYLYNNYKDDIKGYNHDNYVDFEKFEEIYNKLFKKNFDERLNYIKKNFLIDNDMDKQKDVIYCRFSSYIYNAEQTMINFEFITEPYSELKLITDDSYEFKKTVEKYKNNKNFRFRLIDNSKLKGESVYSILRKLFKEYGTVID